MFCRSYKSLEGTGERSQHLLKMFTLFLSPYSQQFEKLPLLLRELSQMQYLILVLQLGFSKVKGVCYRFSHLAAFCAGSSPT